MTIINFGMGSANTVTHHEGRSLMHLRLD